MINGTSHQKTIRSQSHKPVLIIPTLWDHPTDSASWVVRVAGSPWDQMHVAMQNGLTSVYAGIRSDIESGYGVIGVLNFEPHLFDKRKNGISFGLEQIEEVRDVSLWNHQRMQSGNWVSIANCNSQTILANDALTRHLAENASGQAIFISFNYSPEVGVVAVPLRCIARITKRLKIEDVIHSSVVARDNMVYLQSFFSSRNTAQFASELGALQNLIAQCSRNIAIGLATVATMGQSDVPKTRLFSDHIRKSVRLARFGIVLKIHSGCRHRPSCLRCHDW